jgi:hypothetical protein
MCTPGGLNASGCATLLRGTLSQKRHRPYERLVTTSAIELRQHQEQSVSHFQGGATAA